MADRVGSTVDGWVFKPAAPSGDGSPETRPDAGPQARGGSPVGRTANGKRRADRARQFMPFAALRGYYDLIRRQERVREPKHELTEEEAERLSQKLVHVRRGDLVRIRHYDGDAYVWTEGMVSRIDLDLRFVAVVKRRIPFDDILDIEGESIPPDPIP